MKFSYSTITRTLTVFGSKMTHIFENVGIGEIDDLIINAKFKEANWRWCDGYSRYKRTASSV